MELELGRTHGPEPNNKVLGVKRLEMQPSCTKAKASNSNAPQLYFPNQHFTFIFAQPKPRNDITRRPF